MVQRWIGAAACARLELLGGAFRGGTDVVAPLRRAIRWTGGRKMWTRAHRERLRGQRLEHAADQDILDDHLLALEQNEGRLAALDEKRTCAL